MDKYPLYYNKVIRKKKRAQQDTAQATIELGAENKAQKNCELLSADIDEDITPIIISCSRAIITQSYTLVNIGALHFLKEEYVFVGRKIKASQRSKRINPN